MIIVTAGIIFNNSKILIARRSSEKHLAGFWEFPGGKIEDGETLEECLKRELFEELGITVNVKEYFMENNHDYGTKQVLLKAFFCEYVSGDIVLNDHDQTAWVEKHELINFDFAPADVPFIKVLNGK